MKKFFGTLKQTDKDGSKINIVTAALHMWDEVTTQGPRPFRCVHVNVEKRTARFIIHRNKQPTRLSRTLSALLVKPIGSYTMQCSSTLMYSLAIVPIDSKWAVRWE